jgi:hypothetical protein
MQNVKLDFPNFTFCLFNFALLLVVTCSSNTRFEQESVIGPVYCGIAACGELYACKKFL